MTYCQRINIMTTVIIGALDALYGGEAIESINNRDPPDVRDTE